MRELVKRIKFFSPFIRHRWANPAHREENPLARMVCRHQNYLVVALAVALVVVLVVLGQCRKL